MALDPIDLTAGAVDQAALDDSQTATLILSAANQIASALAIASNFSFDRSTLEDSYLSKVPTSVSSYGTRGQWSYDQQYFYICVDTNTWYRCSLLDMPVKGTVVNSLRVGVVAPPDSLGADGDYYLNRLNQLLYGPKTAGHWPSPVSLRGDPGTPGTGLNRRGAWVSGTAYAAGDYVISAGSVASSSIWIANSAFTSSVQPNQDTGNWTELAGLKGDKGDPGTNGSDATVNASNVGAALLAYGRTLTDVNGGEPPSGAAVYLDGGTFKFKGS